MAEKAIIFLKAIITNNSDNCIFCVLPHILDYPYTKYCYHTSGLLFHGEHGLEWIIIILIDLLGDRKWVENYSSAKVLAWQR